MTPMTPMDDKRKRVDRSARALWDGLVNARPLWSPLGYRLTVSQHGNIQFLYKDTDLRVNLIDRGMAFILRVESQTIDLRHLSHLPLELPNGEVATAEDYRDARYELNELNNDYRSHYVRNAKQVVDTLRGLAPRFDKVAEMVPMGEVSSERTASYRLHRLAAKLRKDAVSDEARKKKLLEGLDYGLEELLNGLFKREAELNSLGFSIRSMPAHNRGTIQLSYEGSHLGINLYMRRKSVCAVVTGVHMGSGEGPSPKIEKLVHDLEDKVQRLKPTAAWVLAFLRNEAWAFRTIYDNDETIPEHSSE